MTYWLVHASYSWPEWQAVKLSFFAPYHLSNSNTRPQWMLIKHNLLIIKMQGQGMSRETCRVVIYTKFLIHFSHCCLLRINPCMVQKIQVNENYLSNNMSCEVMLQFTFYVSQFFIFLCIKS